MPEAGQRRHTNEGWAAAAVVAGLVGVAGADANRQRQSSSLNSNGETELHLDRQAGVK
jgi:hypothetical protein